MCAISGIIDFENPVDKQELFDMNNAMILRGPDEGGVFIDEHIGLGHRRLAIIDVKSGHQPMSIEDEQYIIVYNGETYNFHEIKKELQSKGAYFSTESDTEVILWAYKLLGIKVCLDMLEGMYAFAIYDKKLGKAFVARDKFGEKPIYYCLKDDRLVFASELKAFHPNINNYRINHTALNLFLSLSYIPAPYTIYEGINKLEAGHYFEIDLNKGIISKNKYFDVVNEIDEKQTDFVNAQKKIRELLKESIKKRMVSDVPYGAFLSGGIDSSIVCCLMNELSEQSIKTFSIGYKEKDYDETERAELIANHIKSDHTQFTLSYSDVLEILDEIILYYDEPFGDTSAIPSYYVAKLAKEKVSVVLTGDCADELFGGYMKYLADYYTKKYNSYPKFLRTVFETLIRFCPINHHTNNILRKVKKIIKNSKLSDFDLYYSMICLGYDDNSRSNLLRDGLFYDIKKIYKWQWDKLPAQCSFLQKEQLMDSQGVLEGNMFPKMDRACMHVSLENRAPFIDRKLFHLAINLTDELKINGTNKKYILKEAFKDLLPNETLKFGKRGFGVPVDYWFKNELKEELDSLLSRDLIEKQGLFNYDYVNKLLEDHIEGRENHIFKIWNLFVFQKWYTKIYRI